MILEYIPISKLDLVRFNLGEIFQLERINLSSKLPLIALKEKNSYYLIYGFGKIPDKKDSLVPVLSLEFSLSDVANIIFELYNPQILSSTITKAKFISNIALWGISNDVIVERYLSLVGFEKNPKILQYLLNINKLDMEILSFFHVKRYSLKQCIFLMQYGQDLLKFLLSKRDKLNFSASIFEELVENLGEVSGKLGLSFEEFFNVYELEKVFSSFKSSHERTEFFRNFLKSKKSPFITSINEKLELLSQRLDVKMDWDKSLESQKLGVYFSFDNMDAFNEKLSLLSEPKVKDTFEEMLRILNKYHD